ncbi:MAG TPA: hypothetical protein HA232_00070 [Methanocellales archaeon]|nr:hypothetical protein [Methanocellales archaeon]
MTTQRELDLLVDLAKLLKKHGADIFESLAESISSPEMAQHLSGTLIQVAKTGRTIPKTKIEKRLKQEPSIPKSLTTLKSVEPEKYQLLMNFYSDLTEKAVLQSLRDIKEFAIGSGLPEVRAKSRQKAISPLISSLVKFPNEQLITKIQSAKKYDKSDRSLDGWSDIILNRQRR